MASEFTVLSEHGVIATRKDNEFVKVQIVAIGNGQPWLEARVNYVDRNTGDLRPTKAAVTFRETDDLEAFIEALEEAKAAYSAPSATPAVKPNFEVRKPVVGKGAKVAAARRAKAQQAS